MESSPTNYVNALTGVRALAAFMVFLHHYNPFDRSRWEGLSRVVNEFHIGVTMFFVLSGFLITYRYFGAKEFSFRKYMINRMARIYPMYFLVTLITFSVFAILQTEDHSFFSWILNLTFLKGFFDDFKLSGIAQGWSLTTEEMFYLLAPVFFILIRRSKIFLFLLPVALLVIGVILVRVFSRSHLYGFFDSYSFMLDYTFFGRCCEFFTGIALAIILRRGVSMKRNYYFTYTGLLLIFLSMYAMMNLRGVSAFCIDDLFSKIINTLFLPIAGIGLFFAGLITERTFVSRVLGSSFFVIAGKCSYVFYLVHVGVIATFVHAIVPNPVLFLVTICFLSFMLFKYVEEPLNRMIREKFAR